jgi:hypothetical protein
MKYFLNFYNGFYIYIFNNYLIKENQGQRSRVNFGNEYHNIQNQTHSGYSVLVGTTYEDYIDNEGYRIDAYLYLFEVKNQIYKSITIENPKNYKLIG